MSYLNKVPVPRITQRTKPSYVVLLLEKTGSSGVYSLSQAPHRRSRRTPFLRIVSGSVNALGHPPAAPLYAHHTRAALHRGCTAFTLKDSPLDLDRLPSLRYRWSGGKLSLSTTSSLLACALPWASHGRPHCARSHADPFPAPSSGPSPRPPG